MKTNIKKTLDNILYHSIIAGDLFNLDNTFFPKTSLSNILLIKEMEFLQRLSISLNSLLNAQKI